MLDRGVARASANLCIRGCPRRRGSLPPTHVYTPPCHNLPERAAYTALVVNEMDGLTLDGPGGQPVTLQGTPPLTGASHADWGLARVIGMLAGLVGALTLAALAMLCTMVRLKRL